MNLSNYFFLAILILLILVFTGLWFYYRFIKPKHTREKFAFIALSTFASFLITALSLLFARNFAFDWIIQALNSQFELRLPAYKEDNLWINILIFFGATGFLYLLINNIYFGWNGLKSTRQVFDEETKQKRKLYEDFWFYFRKKEEIRIHQGTSDKKREIFSLFQRDERPFHIKAVTLLKLYDRQYNINIEEDWHRKYNAFIGSYKSNGLKVGVLCYDVLPSDMIIDKYLKKYKHQDFEEHIIIIEGKGLSTTKIYGNTIFKIRYESELLNDLIDFSDYKKKIVNWFDKEKLQNKLPLKDIYVPLNGQIKTIEKKQLVAKEGILNVEQYILNWVNTSNDKEHLVLLGDYGQGKTVLTQKIVKEILENPNSYNRIPILIELRGISPRNNEDIDLLGRWANRHNQKAQAVLELHKAGKLLVILDGFDEMDLVADTELLFSHFNEIWALAKYPNAKLIVTGRPNLFADDVERRDALGILPQRVDLPYSVALALESMTQSQIKNALRNVQTKTQKEILTTLKATGKDSSFAELLVRPSTLYQLSTIWDKEIAQYKDRLNSAIVIKQFLDKTYERQDTKHSNVLTTHERNYFMMGIAIGMMLKNQYTNQIRFSDLENLIKKLWDNYPEKLVPYKDSQQGNIQKKFLKKRLENNENALAVVLRDVCSGGILVQDLSGRDMFRFAHKSYMEYLVSIFYVSFILKKENDKNQLMVINSITQTYNFKQTQLASSIDVERFAAEQIVGSIELKDINGNILPQKGNEKEYLKAIYKKVIPHWYGRTFPNLTGWLSLHPAQKYLLQVFMISLGSFILLLETDNNILQQIIICLNIILTSFIFLIIYRYKLYSQYGVIENILNHNIGYSTYVRLYEQSSKLLGQSYHPFKENYYRLISFTHLNQRYSTIVSLMTSIIMFLPCLITNLIIEIYIPIKLSVTIGFFLTSILIFYNRIGIISIGISILVSISITQKLDIINEILIFAVVISYILIHISLLIDTLKNSKKSD